MIDGIKLDLLDQIEKMRKFYGEDARFTKQDGNACNKIIDVGNMRHHVVCGHQIGLKSVFRKPGRRFNTEKCDLRFNASGFRGFGDIGRRLYSENRNTFGQKMLQQITVVAGNLDNEGIAVKSELLRQFIGESPRMFNPTAGEGRKIGVVGKNILRRNHVLDLHQKAVPANPRMQAIGLLRRDIALLPKVTVGKRR